MCQESACKPVKETLALAVEVTPRRRRRPSAQGRSKAKTK